MPRFTLSPEVADALRRRPVLALETSVIAGGLPFPANLELAQAVDDAARAGGAVPARVAVIDGGLHIGLTDEQLRRVAEDPGAVKASIRDLGRVAATGGIGALTVSGAVHGARLAGIEVLAVAGVGGVHRGAASSFDVSADLPAFAHNRVAVVCAGVKSILDAGLTLEWLETHSVPVIGYRCDDFPGYISTTSGRPNPHRLDDLAQIARAVLAHWDTGAESGFLVTHPIAPAHEIPRDQLELQIAEAEQAAHQAGVTGPAITPFLLKELARTSAGQTSAANREVLLSTTRLGAEFAVRLHEARLAAAGTSTGSTSSAERHSVDAASRSVADGSAGPAGSAVSAGLAGLGVLAGSADPAALEGSAAPAGPAAPAVAGPAGPAVLAEPAGPAGPPGSAVSAESAVASGPAVAEPAGSAVPAGLTGSTGPTAPSQLAAATASTASATSAAPTTSTAPIPPTPLADPHPGVHR